MPLAEAVALAKKYVSEAIKASSEIKVGHGNGPVHHFHEFWRKPGA